MSWGIGIGNDEIVNENYNTSVNPNTNSATSGANSPSVNTSSFGEGDVSISLESVNPELVGDGYKFIENTNADNNSLIRGVIDDALNMISVVGSAAADFAYGALASQEAAQAEAFDFGRRSLDTVDDAIISNENVVREGFYLAGDLVNTVERIHGNNTEFLTTTNQELFTTLEELDESRAIQTGQVLETVGELATVVQTGGESITQSVNKAVVIAAIAGMAFVTWQFSRS